MPDSPRRGFLKIAGAGIAAAGAAAVAAPHLTRSTGTTPAALPSEASGALVAYVSDVKGGEVSVMVEGREVLVTDHDLVARLAHAIHANTTA